MEEEGIRNLWISQYDVFKQYHTGIKLDYIIIYLLFAAIVIISSKALSKTKSTKEYWYRSLPIIFSFTIIEGIRYLRGTDYLNYALLYKYHGDYFQNEFIFISLQNFFYWLKLSYWQAFMVYSFIWISGLIYLLKEFRSYVNYILPSFLVLGLSGFECFIRQDVAWAVIFIFIYHLIRFNVIKATLFAIIPFFIHSSSVIFILILLLIYLQKKLISPYITIPMYLLAVYIITPDFIGKISQLISSLPIIKGSVVGFYISNADHWFSADASYEGYMRGFFTKTGSTIFDISTIILSYKYMKLTPKNNRTFTFIFNLTCFSAIFLQLFFTFEIPKRVFLTLYIFISFLVGYIMKQKLQYKYEIIIRNIIIIYIITYFIKNILFAPNQLFIWDAVNKYNLNL
jgi:hypothetical protein